MRRVISTVFRACSYEDYLDSQITKTDLFYLEDVELARQLVELGYRCERSPPRMWCSKSPYDTH